MDSFITAQYAANNLRMRRINPHNLSMNSGDYTYIWQAGDWPNWRFDLAALAGPMAEVSRAQGLLMGRLQQDSFLNLHQHLKTLQACLPDDAATIFHITGGE